MFSFFSKASLRFIPVWLARQITTKITSANLVKAINKEGGNAEILNPANLANKILSMKKSNKVIIMQGAGKISSYLKNFVESCQVKK